jgi:hypothetical protein
VVVQPDDAERYAHHAVLRAIHKESKKPPLWADDLPAEAEAAG